MKRRKFKLTLFTIKGMLVFVFLSFFLLSYSSGENTGKEIAFKKTVDPTKIGDSGQRVGSLGGAVSVTDPTSPIFGASITFGNSDFLKSDRPFIRFLIDNAAKVEKDESKNPRILEVIPTKKTTTLINGIVELKVTKKNIELVKTPFVEPDVIADKERSNILVLSIDSDGDGKGDKFPSYFIKDVKFKIYEFPSPIGQHFPKDEFNNPPIDVYFKEAYLPVFTTYADLPKSGTITMVQVLELPEVIISLNKEQKISKANVIGVGPQVTFGGKNTIVLNKPEGSPTPIQLGSQDPTATLPSKFTAKISVPYYKSVVSALGKSGTDLTLCKLTTNSKGKPVAKVISDAVIDESSGVFTFTNKETDKDADGFGTYQVVATADTETDSIPAVLDVKTTFGSGVVSIKYKVSDAEGNSSDVKIEYRQNPGNDPDAGWAEVTTIKGVKPSVSDNSEFNEFNWKTSLLPGKVSGIFQIRVTPSQKIAGVDVNGAARVSEVFRINILGKTVSSPKGLKGKVTNNADNEVDSNGEETNPPQVSLSWKAVSGDVSGYNVYRKTHFRTGQENSFRKIASTNNTTFTDSKDNGTLFSSFYEALYKLAAFDSSGNESGFSNISRLSSIVFGSYGYYGK